MPYHLATPPRIYNYRGSSIFLQIRIWEKSGQTSCLDPASLRLDFATPLLNIIFVQNFFDSNCLLLCVIYLKSYLGDLAEIKTFVENLLDHVDFFFELFHYFFRFFSR